MRTKLRSKLMLLFMSLAMVVAFPAAAIADDISNNLDNTVDAAAEQMDLVAGGPNGSTTLRVIEANGDGKNGCNLTGSTTFTASVNSSNSSVATVSPSSVTFTSCGDVKTLTVTPLAQGSTTISLNQTGNTTDGSFNLAPATFTVNVSAAGPSCTAPAAPTFSNTTPDGDNGWFKTIPTVSASSTTAGATIEYATDANGPFSSTAPTLGQGETTVYAKASSDSCSTTASHTFKVDTVAPSITDLGPTATPDGENGWYISAVTNNFSASDATSGLANAADASFSKSSGTAEGSAVKINSDAVSDKAGNTNSKDSAAFKIDLSDPSTPTFSGIQAQTYPVSNLPAQNEISCSATDAISPPANCVVDPNGYSSAFGSHTLTATATDQAGRQSTNQLTYIVGLKAGEVLSPINSTGKANPVAPNLDVFKIKSTVPVKFRLFNDDAMTQLMTNPPAGSVAKLTFFRYNSGTASADTAELISAGSANTDNIFRWNATDSQYIYNLGTSGRQAGTYGVQLTLTASDGTQLAQSAKYYFILRA